MFVKKGTYPLILALCVWKLLTFSVSYEINVSWSDGASNVGKFILKKVIVACAFIIFKHWVIMKMMIRGNNTPYTQYNNEDTVFDGITFYVEKHVAIWIKPYLHV